MVGIYKITNNKNRKIYVGQSIDINDRWKQHKYKAFNSKEKGYNSAIHLAFRKYGIENFSFEVIEKCQQDELDEKEQYWIKKLNSLSPNGYNILLADKRIDKVKFGIVKNVEYKFLLSLLIVKNVIKKFIIKQ